MTEATGLSRRALAAEFAAATVAYFLLALVTVRFLAADGLVATIWLPGGAGAAAVVLRGRRMVAAVFVGAAAYMAWSGFGWATALGLAIGHTAATAVAAGTMQQRGPIALLATGPRFFRVLLEAAVAGGTTSAISGVGVLALAGHIVPSRWPDVLFHWWQGDVAGILLVVPTLLVWRRFPAEWFRWPRLIETLACFGLTTAAAYLVLQDRSSSLGRFFPGGTTLVIWVGWAAVRFGRRGGTLAMVIVALAAVRGAVRGTGYFAVPYAMGSTSALWLYCLTIATLAVALSTTFVRQRLLDRARSSERDLADARARESQEQYRSLVERLPDGLVVAGLDGRLQFANDQFLALAGARREPGVTLQFTDFMTPEAFGAFTDWFALADDGTPMARAMEGELRRADGSGLWVSVKTSPVIANGAVVGLQAIVRDVTDQRRAEELISESEERFRAVFEQSPNILVLSDAADMRIVYVNAAGERAFGLPRAQIIGRTGESIGIWPDPAVRARLLAEFKARGSLVAEPVVFRRGDGEPFDALFTCRLVSVSGRRYILQSITDVSDLRQSETERVRAVQQLQTHVSLLEATLESTADGILVVSEDGTIARFNRRFAEMWRIPQDILASRRDDLALRHVLQQLLDPDGFLATVQRLYADPWAESFDELDFIDGRRFERYSRPQLVDGRPTGRVWSFRDVTARVRDEETRRQLEEQLRHSQKLEAVGTLAGGIAHDFNNILTVILGNAEIASADLPPDAPARRRIATATAAAERGVGLVRRMLAFSRAESGTRTPVQLEGVLRETLEFLRPTLPANVEIALDIAAPLPPVLADATQVHQVVLNLCTNAWHAIGADPGRVTISAADVTVDGTSPSDPRHSVAPGRYVRVAVTDTGGGIEDDVLTRMFNPFFTTKPVGQGSGLGLAMVHGIMRAHDGAVTVSTTVGVGSSFRLWFPVSAAQPAAPPPAPATAPHGGGERVLVVDDEAGVAEVTTEILTALEYRVTTESSPELALARFAAAPHEFAAVVTDLTMPRMSGIELARRLRVLRDNIPVVICTGYTDDRTAREIAAIGGVHVLHKPVAIRVMAQALTQAIAGNGPSAPRAD